MLQHFVIGVTGAVRYRQEDNICIRQYRQLFWQAKPVNSAGACSLLGPIMITVGDPGYTNIVHCQQGGKMRFINNIANPYDTDG
jgi:hypothetical protein